MLTCDEVADYFLSSQDIETGDTITHLKLQKLVYYAQAWSLALRGEPLFEEDFEAWVHGPALRSLYARFADYKWAPIPQTAARTEIKTLPREIIAFLDEVSDVYGQFSAKKLEELTHNEDPWIEARKGCSPIARSDALITKDSMARYYKGVYEQHHGERAAAQ